jgi:hypothetical protein
METICGGVEIAFRCLCGSDPFDIEDEPAEVACPFRRKTEAAIRTGPKFTVQAGQHIDDRVGT